MALLPLLVGLLAGPPPPLVYPLAHPPAVTSTFGTYRISHHHAGLDLVTGDDETVAVLAAAEGEVYRIKRSSVGYGRAVYVRHPGGWQTVYGHLSSFAPALAAEVHRRANDADKFEVAFNLKAPIPVKAGEALGTVGTSGTDLVHLHFELRRDGQPVNPLRFGLPVPDTQAPVIGELLAIPIAPDAHVAQAHDALRLPLGAGASKEPLRLGGDVRLHVEVKDRIDGDPRDLTPYEIELFIDGKRWHRTRYDEVSYADTRHTELDFEAERNALREGRFNKLFAEGPRLRVHAPGGRSLARLRPGRHPAEIVSRDAAGNVARARFEIQVERPAPPCVVQAARLKPPRSLGAPASAREWRGDTVILALPALCAGGGARLDLRLDGKPMPKNRWRISRLGGEPALAVRLPADRDSHLTIGVAPAEGPAEWAALEVFAVRPGATIERGPVHLAIDDAALFFEYPSEVRAIENPGAEGLEAVGPLFRFGNPWVPAKGYSVIRLRRGPEAAGPHVGVYLHSRGKAWRLGGLEDGDWVQSGWIHLGDMGLMRDVAGPVIGSPYLDPHPAGPRLVVPVKDAGAGLAEVTVAVDGQPVGVELQRAFDRALWLPARQPGPGPHVIAIEARDRSGRRARGESTVVWPAP